jgi:hypothetical protein
MTAVGASVTTVGTTSVTVVGGGRVMVGVLAEGVGFESAPQAERTMVISSVTISVFFILIPFNNKNSIPHL